MSDKNMADVADKAIDKVADALGPMVEAAKKVAPHAWEIMVRQQIIEGCVVLGEYLVCLLAVAVYMKWASKLWSEEAENHYNPFGLTDRALWRAITSVGLLICMVIAFLAVVPDAVMQVANPEYYAIKVLVGK